MSRYETVFITVKFIFLSTNFVSVADVFWQDYVSNSSNSLYWK